MKTLDEVIKGFECCENTDCGNCPYKILFNDDSHVPCDQFSKDDDALHYLKEYKAKEMFYNQSVDHIVQMMNEHEDRVSFYLAEMNRNPPLTWAELKQMEGKPVWVEGEHGCIWDQKSWVLIRLDNDNEDLIICVATNNGHYEFAIGKEDYGKDWQAYRKERNEDAE